MVVVEEGVLQVLERVWGEVECGCEKWPAAEDMSQSSLDHGLQVTQVVT